MLVMPHPRGRPQRQLLSLISLQTPSEPVKPSLHLIRSTLGVRKAGNSPASIIPQESRGYSNLHKPYVNIDIELFKIIEVELSKSICVFGGIKFPGAKHNPVTLGPSAACRFVMVLNQNKIFCVVPNISDILRGSSLILGKSAVILWSKNLILGFSDFLDFSFV